MVELNVKGSISADVISELSSEDLEQFIEEDIVIKITTEIASKLEELTFIDIAPGKDGAYDYTADFVLCSAEAIIEGIHKQSAVMGEYGLTTEQIEKILSLTTGG